VMQETFTYLLRKFPGFILSSSLISFFYPAVKNLSIAARRKRQRAISGTDCLDELLAPPVSVEPSELVQALSGLSDLNREVILMRFVDELGLEEISVALDIPIGTVKSRLHNALQLLRDDPRARRYFQQ
jgi:RNA polymerase sigma-70 factor, ECF subfamily